MTRKIIKIITIAVIFLVGMQLSYPKAYAAGTVDDIVSGAEGFLGEGADASHDTSAGGYQSTAGLDETKLKETSDFIYNLLFAIAMVVAVIIGLVIGIKFMVSSVEEKAKIKELLLPYVVGCGVVFGAFGIWSLVVNILMEWKS